VCSGSGGFATREDGKDAGDLATDEADASGVLELAGGLLETEVEGFLLEFAELESEFVGRALANIFNFGFGHDGNG